MPTSAGLYNEKQPLRLAKFSDLTESNARQLLESLRWPDGPVCVHCGEIGNVKRINARADSKKPVRKGVWKCYGCREQFSVTVGTVFEDSHIELHRWLLVAYLMCASKKGMSAHQIHRMLGISYKTVWFMCHRLRFAMSQHGMIEKLRGVVEIDEVWVGPKEKGSGLRGTGRVESKKRPVVALMERNANGSRVRSFPVERVTLNNINPIMKQHVEVGTRIQTERKGRVPIAPYSILLGGAGRHVYTGSLWFSEGCF